MGRGNLSWKSYWMESRTKWDTSIMTGDSIHNPETPDSLNVYRLISPCVLSYHMLLLCFLVIFYTAYLPSSLYFILFIFSNCITLHFQCHKSHLQYLMPSLKPWFLLKLWIYITCNHIYCNINSICSVILLICYM